MIRSCNACTLTGEFPDDARACPKCDKPFVHWFEALVRSFPTLADAPHTCFLEPHPFGTNEFQQWCHCWGDPGEGKRAAMQFVMHVYSAHMFDLRHAWHAWDSAHRAAWLAWAKAPRWM